MSAAAMERVLKGKSPLDFSQLAKYLSALSQMSRRRAAA